MAHELVDGWYGRSVRRAGAEVAWISGVDKVNVPGPPVHAVITDLLVLVNRRACCGPAIYTKGQKHAPSCSVLAADKMLEDIEFAEESA